MSAQTASVTEPARRALAEAAVLMADGSIREAIDHLTEANRRQADPTVERELVRMRYEGCALLAAPEAASRPTISAEPNPGGLVELSADELSADAVRSGFARSGCVLVRGLVDPERVSRLVAGVDAAFAGYDASVAEDGAPDGDWYVPFAMPDLISCESAGAAVTVAPGSPPAKSIPVRAHRRLSRKAGGVWMAESPRMLFEFLELVEDIGMGALMTGFFGERPLLSANKCNVRRIPPEEMTGGWHQDGAFLGDGVGSFNFWLSLTRCGQDAPGLDLLPKRLDRILEAGGEDSFFKWSLSDRDVELAAEGTPVVRPDFEAGDALLFDHRLVHRTGTSPSMTQERHAIESWFFARSSFPLSQLPLVF